MLDLNDFLVRQLLSGLATKWIRKRIDLDEDGIRSRVKFHEIGLDHIDDGQVQIDIHVSVVTGEKQATRLIDQLYGND